MIVATKPMDDAFHSALEGKPAEWKVRAIAAYTSRTVADHCRMNLEPLNQHGLSRTRTAAEREAWAFGFGWPDRKVAT
jgi:hypothetical protein